MQPQQKAQPHQKMTMMDSFNLSKASTVTIPQTWNRTKYNVTPYPSDYKGLTIDMASKVKELKEKTVKKKRQNVKIRPKTHKYMSKTPVQFPYSKLFDANLTRIARDAKHPHNFIPEKKDDDDDPLANLNGKWPKLTEQYVFPPLNAKLRGPRSPKVHQGSGAKRLETL